MKIDPILKKQEELKLGFLYRCSRFIKKERETRLNAKLDEMPFWFKVSPEHFNRAKAFLQYMQQEGGVVPELLTYLNEEILFDSLESQVPKGRFSMKGAGFYFIDSSNIVQEHLGSPWDFNLLVRIAQETGIENLPLHVHGEVESLLIKHNLAVPCVF